jgi:SAM-dependent methyltransferase
MTMAAASWTRHAIEHDALFGDVIARAATYSRERVAQTALELLALRSEDVVLELGCGSGRLVARVAARVQRGAVVGIDPSPLMVRHAGFRNRRFVERGVLELRSGASDDLSAWPAAHFDKVYGLHVVYFWRTPERDLAEIRRVLRPGGRLVLGFCPEEESTRSIEAARCRVARVEEWLERAGFRSVEGRCERHEGRPLAWLRATR